MNRFYELIEEEEKIVKERVEIFKNLKIEFEEFKENMEENFPNLFI